MNKIDMDPAMEYTVRIESDKDELASLLGEAVGSKISAYEIIQFPAGLKLDAQVMSKENTFMPHIKGFYAYVKFYSDPDQEHYVFFAQSDDLGETHPQDIDVFYYAGNLSEEIIRTLYSEEAKNGHFYIVPKAKKDYENCMQCGWGFIPSINGASSSKCKACCRPFIPVVEVENNFRNPERNRLHLYKLYTINSDLREGDPVFVMAMSEEAAACHFHKARARDHGNIIYELIVTMVSHAENADE